MTVIDPQTEAKKLRTRDASAEGSARHAGIDAASPSPTIVAQTKTLSTYPTAAQRFYACKPVVILGAEVEGGSGVITADSSTVMALNIGTSIPPVGTNVILSYCADRWLFAYN